jgi:7-cyano-7-deazaguanine reductase
MTTTSTTTIALHNVSDPLSPLAPALTPQQVVFPTIDTWPNAYPNRRYTISIVVQEFTSVCPKTGLPDFGTITIDYQPAQACVELKAFKYYTLAYRNMGIFYENAMNRILDDIVTACNPHYIKLTGQFTARGGINTSVVIEHTMPVQNQSA